MPPRKSLNRFHEAQQGRVQTFPNYETALREMQKGKKSEHWIWYILPQLELLGWSEIAKFYGISDFNEACDYLRDPALFERYFTIVKLIEAQLKSIPIEQLMGGKTDAQKLISSVTLFAEVTAYLDSQTHDERYDFKGLKDCCEAVLSQFSPCEKTRVALGLRLDMQKSIKEEPKPPTAPAVDQLMTDNLNQLAKEVLKTLETMSTHANKIPDIKVARGTPKKGHIQETSSRRDAFQALHGFEKMVKKFQQDLQNLQENQQNIRDKRADLQTAVFLLVDNFHQVFEQNKVAINTHRSVFSQRLLNVLAAIGTIVSFCLGIIPGLFIYPAMKKANFFSTQTKSGRDLEHAKDLIIQMQQDVERQGSEVRPSNR